MIAARATGSSSHAAAAQLTSAPGRTPPWRCPHRPSRRTPHPTIPTAELCRSCGATFHRGQE